MMSLLAHKLKPPAAILKIDEKAIFPVSAKQALLAKVKSDAAFI